MDWSLIWTAVGAIGTTVGCLVTAIAVVVAVRQFRQPIVKKIKIQIAIAFPVIDNAIGEMYFSISISNIGIRVINISNVYLKVKSKLLLINNLMFNMEEGNTYGFPISLIPEDNVNICIPYDELSEEFKRLINNKVFNPNYKVHIQVTDSTGENYVKSLKMSLGKIAGL
jgi:hypothetical protein